MNKKFTGAKVCFHDLDDCIYAVATQIENGKQEDVEAYVVAELTEEQIGELANVGSLFPNVEPIQVDRNFREKIAKLESDDKEFAMSLITDDGVEWQWCSDKYPEIKKAIYEYPR